MSANPYVATLQRERDQLWRSGEQLLSDVAEKRRQMTPAESRMLDQRGIDLDLIDQRLAILADDERRTADFASRMAEIAKGPKTMMTNAESTAEATIDVAFRRAILNNDNRPIDVGPTERRSCFQPGIERRDVTPLTTGSGGGMLGVTFHDRLVRHLVESSSVLAAGATVMQSESGEPFVIPKSTANSTAVIVPEGGLIPESEPTLGKVTLGAFKYGFLVYCTYEMAQDTAFDLTGYLAEQAGVALGNAFGAHSIAGIGTTEPRGILLDATTGTTGAAATAGAFTADDLIDLYSSVAAPYARSSSAAWLMNGGTLGAVRKLRNVVDGTYLFDTSTPLGSGASGSLLGRPVYVDPSVPSVGALAKSILFGDISRYWVRQVGGVRFEKSSEVGFTTDTICFRALARLDGALVDTSGSVKAFVGGAAA